MSGEQNRRRFIKRVAAAAGTLLVETKGVWGGISTSTLQSSSPNSRLNIAGIGVAGKGASDLRLTSKGQNVVAICDVDKRALEKAAVLYPNARVFQDWRKVLELKEVEAVTISTPDHMHAPIAMSAIRSGRHVYVQKPLTHTIYEARQLAKAVRDQKVVSQMGNQHHSGSGYRTFRQIVQSGMIGKIKEAHTWSNRPIWPQGIERPGGADPVPGYLNWDLWLGVAPKRPFVGIRDEVRRNRGVYHPFNWRGWLDFGVGALGDMGCHIIDPVIWSLELESPTSVSADCPPINQETYPEWEVIHYTFPATDYTTGPLRMTWYDGGRQPRRELLKLLDQEETPSNGCLLVGEKGTVLCPHGEKPRLLPQKQFEGVEIPEIEGVDHYQQWTMACKGEGKTTSPFGYAGPLTETVLLGTIAIRFPKRVLVWDSERLRFANSEKASHFVHHFYRKGWEVEGLS
jgi:predicted dehydrogenase